MTSVDGPVVTAPVPLCGLMVVDKPLHLSSMDVVRHVRRAARAGGGDRKLKVGHAGTLDPLATGVVICCIGKATKLVDQLMGLTKVYETTIDLGAFTATDDREGEREEVVVALPPDEAMVREVLPRFVGEIQQVPPAFSAIHIDGQRAYALARKGKEVKINARTVRVDAIDLLEYAWPLLTLRITCGKGTYIRSLARDIGSVLNTGGHLASLRRTQVGPYHAEQAHSIQRFESPVTQKDLLDPPSQTTAR